MNERSRWCGLVLQLAIAALALSLAACSGESVSPAPNPAEPNETTITEGNANVAEEDEPATGSSATQNDEPTAEVLDARTVLFRQGTDPGVGRSLNTPPDEAVRAAIATIDSAPELAWAAGHNRFLFGSEEPAGTPAIRLFFACSQDEFADTEQALELLKMATAVDGGGDCYGEAALGLDGTLIWSRTN